MKVELDKVGVRLLPDLATADRGSCVELSLQSRGDGQTPVQSMDETILVSWWRAGEVGDEHPLGQDQASTAGAGILWFNVEPLRAAAPKDTPADGRGLAGGTRWRRQSPSEHSARPSGTEHPQASMAALDQRVTDVFTRLAPLCEGLDEEMVKDLLSADAQPKVEPYGYERDGIRGVSAVAVIAHETPSGPEDPDGVSKELIFQLVETIVGGGWIITCWHPSQVFAGPAQVRQGHQVLREPFLSHVRYRWLQNSGRVKTSSDLGMYLTRSLVDTYGASHRMIELWTKSWELDFYGYLSDAKMETIQNATVEISNVLSLVGEFRRRLTAFHQARWATSDKAWFPRLSDLDGPTDEGTKETNQVELLDAAVHAAEMKLDQLFESIRADMDLLMLRSVGTQQGSSERLQRQLAKVTALLLVPTLIAGIFGANTQLPGGGSWLGFDLMIVLMICSSVGVYLTMRNDFHDSRRRPSGRKHGDTSPG